ncbi:MAG: aldo/keto reductase, partial [Clostridia bacterium]|nr:aldo/keto reductase [Clostridia bacterium]
KNKLKETAADLKKGIIAFSPLEQGVLTDRYLDGIPQDSRIRTDGRYLTEKSLAPERMEKVKNLSKIAHERGQTLAQMALAWVLKDEAVTSVLIGASKPEQIVENLASAENNAFSKEELEAIDKIVL